MKTANICPTREAAEQYIARMELTTAKIVEYNADRSDPRWIHKVFAVQVTRQEYFEKVYYK
jgi:hypothetical protein